MSIKIEIEIEREEGEAEDKSEPRHATEFVDHSWRNFPLQFRGKDYPSDAAIRFMQSNRWIDPVTGKDWTQCYDTFEAAESALKRRLSGKDSPSQREMEDEIFGTLRHGVASVSQ